MSVGYEVRSTRWRLAALSLTMLLSSVGTSIANVALPTIALSFHAPFREVQWVVIAYLLAITTLMVGVGNLGDIFGRRRLLLAGIAIFSLASAACAFAPNLWLLVAARGVQGVGAASMMALSVASIGGAVSKDRMGSAMGLLGTMSAVGTALGPSLGGGLVALLGWPSVFAFVAILGVIALLFCALMIPVDTASDRVAPSFDVVGTVLLALSLAAYALTMTLGGSAPTGISIVLACGTVAGGLLFAAVEIKVRSPLVGVALLRDRGLVAALISMALVSTIIMATLVVGPFYLSRLPAFSPAAVGIVMSIGPVTAAIMGIPAGRFVDRFGATATTIAALTGVAAGAALMAILPGAAGVIGYVGALTILTASYAAFQAANTTMVMSGASPDRRGLTSGLLGLARNLGLITGTAAMSALYASGGLSLAFAVAAVLGALALVLSKLSTSAR